MKARNKRKATNKSKTIRIKAEFSTEIWEPRRHWKNTFKTLEDNHFPNWNSCQEKLYLKN